jgi:hypothetical protein
MPEPTASSSAPSSPQTKQPFGSSAPSSSIAAFSRPKPESSRSRVSLNAQAPFLLVCEVIHASRTTTSIPTASLTPRTVRSASLSSSPRSSDAAPTSPILDHVFGPSWRDLEQSVRESSNHSNVHNWGLFSFIVKAGDDLRQEQVRCIYSANLCAPVCGPTAGTHPADISTRPAAPVGSSVCCAPTTS